MIINTTKFLIITRNGLKGSTQFRVITYYWLRHTFFLRGIFNVPMGNISHRSDRWF